MKRSLSRPLRAVFALCALLCVAPAASVRAFSDIERFPRSVQEGGGGGRLFTGSPADGYACSVCHLGGEEPSVIVYGLPIDGYVPGQTYDVEVAWNNVAGSHALHLEIVDEATKRGAGRVSLIDPATIDARGRCGSLPNEKPADYILEGEGRQIIGSQGCGASSVRFRFTAPNVPEIVFAGSVVRAGEPQASPEGDGVQNLNRVLRRAGEPNQAASTCALTAARRSGAGLWCGVLLMLALALRLPRARR
jgi:hypothetical protein